MHVRIVEAHECDTAHRLRLHALSSDPFAFGATLDEESSMSAAEVSDRYSPSEAGFVVGAFDDAGALAGMVGFRRQKGSKRRHGAQIWGLYVDAEARGKGLARALMTTVLKEARTRVGFTQVTLGVSSVAERAKSLYRSLGFESYGVEPNAHRQDGRSIDMEFMVYVFDLRSED